MMHQMSLSDAALRFGGTLVNPDGYFSAVSIDSRSTNSGDLFVAVEGERFDGHHFIEKVASKISGAVVSKPNKSLKIPQWVVEDTTRALGDIAVMRRDSFQGSVIALTGSSGKTSVKEAIAKILSQSKRVHATQGNLNNHFGVPLTLLSMDSQADVAVIEMGASALGEIEYLCTIAKPDIALVNNAQSAHIEGFGSHEAIASAKAEIYEGLHSKGIAVINLDQPWVKQWLEVIKDRDFLSFSITNQNANLFAKDIEDSGNGCFTFTLCLSSCLSLSDGEQVLTLRTPGLHSVSNALAAAACAAGAGASLAQIITGLESVNSIPGRLQHKIVSDTCLVIDDSYNANPDSFKSAIDVLSNTQDYRILVMGDMGELGDHTKVSHREVGRYAKDQNIECFYSTGVNSKFASEEFGGNHFHNQEALIGALDAKVSELQALGKNLTILVKGSRSSSMENIVQALVTGEKISC